MSTFNGTIIEIPGISIDRFDGMNLDSEAFFLSHCHSDHMQGLDNPKGLPSTLYTSEISAVFVKHQFPKINKIVSIELGDPKSIKLKNGEEILVTAKPAVHCPGSLMFLFQSTSHKVLYTGDFRLLSKDIPNITALKDIELDSLYLDTTFFHKDFLDFPPQEDSSKVICTLITEWLKQGPEYIISIRIPAKFGSEFLFMEIYKATGIKIHVKNAEHSKYKYLATLDGCVTRDPNTQIHGCRMGVGNYYSLNCRKIDEKYIRVIRPSAVRWRKWQKTKEIYEKIGNFEEVYGVCYSNHSSCNEVIDFLKYLKPKTVKFNVISELGKGTQEDELLRMEKMTDEILNDKAETSGSKEDKLNFSFNNISKRRSKKRIKVMSDSSEDNTDEDKEEHELPKRSKI